MCVRVRVRMEGQGCRLFKESRENHKRLVLISHLLERSYANCYNSASNWSMLFSPCTDWSRPITVSIESCSPNSTLSSTGNVSRRACWVYDEIIIGHQASIVGCELRWTAGVLGNSEAARVAMRVPLLAYFPWNHYCARVAESLERTMPENSCHRQRLSRLHRAPDKLSSRSSPRQQWSHWANGSNACCLLQEVAPPSTRQSGRRLWRCWQEQ